MIDFSDLTGRGLVLPPVVEPHKPLIMPH